MGLVLAEHRFELDKSKRPYWLSALIWPILFHSAYDFFLSATDCLGVAWLGWSLAMLIFAGWIVNVVEYKNKIQNKLFKGRKMIVKNAFFYISICS